MEKIIQGVQIVLGVVWGELTLIIPEGDIENKTKY